jgi:hypothetical protein
MVGLPTRREMGRPKPSAFWLGLFIFSRGMYVIGDSISKETNGQVKIWRNLFRNRATEEGHAMGKWEPIFWIWVFGAAFFGLILLLQSMKRKKK